MRQRASAMKPVCLLAVCLSLLWVQAHAGNRRHALTFDHYKRYYFVHIPPERPGKYALVINLHGGGAQGRSQEEFSGMDRTADKYGFYVVYPNGSGRLRNRMLTWNAGSCCGYAYTKQMDDVGFISQVLDAMIKEYPIDASRVYVTGMSNGAMMAYYLAEKMPDRIAAIAPVAGGLLPTNQHVRPMPIMHFHSLADPRAHYHGGAGPAQPLSQERVMHPDIDAVLAAWAKINGCETQRKQVDMVETGRGKQHEIARKFAYAQCRNAPVELWQYDRAGHVWPGGEQRYMERTLGPGTKVVNANELMWRFFRRYRREQH